ncbi:MAG: cytochrome c3 family protein [Desulfovermiculus sp.]|nr:cytochrome c3 family protein [Desulfovermiculus sp.]
MFFSSAKTLAGVILALTLILPGLHAMDLPETMLMDDSQEHVQNPVYAPVLMPHEIHLSISCQACHHEWKDESSPPLKCSDDGCHDIFGAEGDQKTAVRSAFNAYHNRSSELSCHGCHLQRSQAGEASGPVNKCLECHSGK